MFTSPSWAQAQPDGLIYAHGGIVRTDTTRSRLHLVFTGDRYAAGCDTIRRILSQRGIRAAFFFTGRFYREPSFAPCIRALRDEGHYLGAHSDRHLLYASWQDRNILLVGRDSFRRDLRANYAEMARFGVGMADAPLFMPPYEWYNDSISAWVREEGLQLVNFTPGTRAQADYTTPDLGKGYVGNQDIWDSITSFEADAGLRGFILLTHIGAGPKRPEKFYFRLGELLDWLDSKGYAITPLDEAIGQP